MEPWAALPALQGMPIDLFSSNDPIRLQPFFGYRNDSRVQLSVRAMRGDDPDFEQRSFLDNIRTMIKQYASHEVADLEVTLEYTGGDGEVHRQTLRTDDEGFAHFSIELPQGSTLPLKTAWERALVSWSPPSSDEQGGETQAFVLAPGREAKVGVISDIDDTILETGITGSVKAIASNWKRVLAQMPDQRELVPGARGLYSSLGGEAGLAALEDIPQARPRPVFYVSSSPWNLFSYLVTFKEQQGMPLGPVMLRDWGFNTKTLGSKSHGSHKRAAIERILGEYPNMQFALVGDDTQKDLIAFGAIAASHTHQIAAIFIRRASDEPLNDQEKTSVAEIKRAGVPFWIGADYSDAQAFLDKAGLDFDPKIDRLVKTVSEGDRPAP